MIDEKILINFINDLEIKKIAECGSRGIPYHEYEKDYGFLFREIKEIIQDLKQMNRQNYLTELKILDKADGSIHVVGEDPHDCLMVKNGVVEYYNLQNGEGTGEDSDYKFIEKDVFDPKEYEDE